MSLKHILKTVRLTHQEERSISLFLKRHPYLRNFSALVRSALTTALQRPAAIGPDSAPGFLWDYDLTDSDIRTILAGPQAQRTWLVAKILEHGSWEETWRYLTPQMIAQDLPKLRLPARTKTHWQYALQRWRM